MIQVSLVQEMLCGGLEGLRDLLEVCEMPRGYVAQPEVLPLEVGMRASAMEAELIIASGRPHW